MKKCCKFLRRPTLDPRVMKCVWCGCRHFTLKADKGKLFVKGSDA